MLKKIMQNWLTISFLVIIIVVGLSTVLFNSGKIATTSFVSIRNKLNADGMNYELFSYATSVFEGSFAENVSGKEYWIELLGVFNRATGKKIVNDSQERYIVYKMLNGQETWNYIGYDSDEFAKSYINFANDVEKNNIPLLYVQAPFKVDKYNNQLPYGIKDETNLLADNFIDIVSESCDTLDLRDEIHNNGLPHASMFYNTDHHWTSEAGLWASGVIAQRIAERYEVELDVSHLSEENYSFTTYEKYMLGSQGKRAGLLFSGVDDFVLIEPLYETNYILSIPTLDIKKSGDYSETILFKENLKKDYFQGDPGRVYTGDNYSLMYIENLLATNDTKILLIKDSFSKTVIPSFSSTCRELHVIDLRSFEGSVVDYAVDKDIDIIVVIYNPSVVVNSEFFEFD